MAKKKDSFILSPTIVILYPATYISTVNISNDIERRLGVHKIKLMATIYYAAVLK